MSNVKKALQRVVAAVATAFLLTACVTNSEQGNPDGWQEIRPTRVDSLAKLVPAHIAERGTLLVGANVPYAPMQFRSSEGDMVGVEFDLVRAAASVLGLEMQPMEQDFSLILPTLQAGTIDVGASSFTDNAERRQNFDFVDFLAAGVQWAQHVDKPVSRENACGLSISVQRATVSETDDIRPLSEECIAAGKEPIEVLSYASADQAATALVLGRVDAFSSDSPVAAFAIKRANGRLEESGEMFDAAPFGWAVAKDSALGPALAAALQHLIDTGEYARILGQWGIEDGYVQKAEVNPPLS